MGYSKFKSSSLGCVTKNQYFSGPKASSDSFDAFGGERVQCTKESAILPQNLKSVFLWIFLKCWLFLFFLKIAPNNYISIFSPFRFIVQHCGVVDYMYRLKQAAAVRLLRRLQKARWLCTQNCSLDINCMIFAKTWPRSSPNTSLPKCLMGGDTCELWIARCK